MNATKHGLALFCSCIHNENVFTAPHCTILNYTLRIRNVLAVIISITRAALNQPSNGRCLENSN